MQIVPLPIPAVDLLTNHGFESGGTGWINMAKGVIVTAPVRYGTRALELNASSDSAKRVHQTEQISAGKSYEVGGWIAVQSIQAGARLELEWRTDNGKISIVVIGGNATGTMDWAEKSAVVVAPSNATRARLNLYLAKESDGGGKVWFDELSLVRTN